MTTSADVSVAFAFLPKTITNEEMKCRRQQMLETLQKRINADKSRGIEYMKNKWGHSIEDRSGVPNLPQQKCDFNNAPNFVEMWGNGQTKNGEIKILMHEHGSSPLRDKNTEEVKVQSTSRIKISAETLRTIQKLKSRIRSKVEEKPLTITSCDLNVNSDVEIPSEIITDEEINSRPQNILQTLQNRMKLLPKQDEVDQPIPERPKWDFDNSPGSFIELDGQIFKKTPLESSPAIAAEEIEISEQEQDSNTEEVKVQPKSGIKVSTEILEKIQQLKSRIKNELDGKPLKNFPFKNNFKIHVGDGDLNECPFCSKKYHFKSAFEIHLRRHTGERPYICSLCSSGYRQRRDLNNHALRAHGWTPENIVKRRQKRGRGRPRKNFSDLGLGLNGSSNGLVRLTRIKKFI